MTARWLPRLVAGVSFVLVVVALAVSGRPAAALVRCDVHAFEPGARWRGTYTCAQGLTDLVLVIGSVRGTHVDAVFDFDWRAGGIRGRFDVAGTFDGASCRLHLAPVRWLAQPRGWVMVGLDGTLSRDGATYSGRVSDQSVDCTTFRLAHP